MIGNLTLADLEPRWNEEYFLNFRKTSARIQGTLKMSLERVSRLPEGSQPYSHGDPVRLIDWRAYARTDQLVVRKQRDEASSDVSIVVDLGEQMDWPNAAAREEIVQATSSNIPTKLEVAIRIGSWLLHNHLVLGDSPTFTAIQGNKTLGSWKPRSTSEVMDFFSATDLTLVQRLTKLLTTSLPSKNKSDFVWILSDAIDDQIELDQLMDLGKKFSFLHILSSSELDVGWMQDTTAYIETVPLKKEYLGSQLKQSPSYHEKIRAWQQEFQTRTRRLGGTFAGLTDRTKVSDFFHFVIYESAQ